MVTKEEYELALKIMKEYRLQLENELDNVRNDFDSNNIHISRWNKEMSLNDTYSSTRLINAIMVYSSIYNLNMNHRSKCSELHKISISDFAKCRGVGRNTRVELEDLCFSLGIELQP